MEFIKRMKKREFIEMGLKTAMAILFGIVLIFAMEAMIYGIHIKSIKNNTSFVSYPSSVVYYIEKVNNNSYNVYQNDPTVKKLNWKVENIDKATLDARLYQGGSMYRFDAKLYKIEVNNAGSLETYEYDSVNHKGAFEKVKELYSASHEGVTFSVYTKANSDDAYHLKFENISYDSLNFEFTDLPGSIGKNPNAKIYWRAPNCFDIYINWIHYLVMVIFLAIIGGVYAWRFTLISKEYKKIERKFKKTGKIFA